MQKHVGQAIVGNDETVPLTRIKPIDRADDFDDVWVYAVDFFQRCAVRLADMPAERLGLARSCMHRQLIGGRAIELKALRRSKSYVNNYFRRIGQSADDVVDAAWTSSDSRGDFKLKLWNDCLGPDAS